MAGESSSLPQVNRPAAPGRIQRVVRKYLNIFRVSLTERMTYRGDFLLATFLLTIFRDLTEGILVGFGIGVLIGRSART